MHKSGKPKYIKKVKIMAKNPFFLIPLLLVVVVVSMPQSMSINQKIDMPSSDQCAGSLIECLEANESETGSEIKRRILITTQFISYGAMEADRVPCSERGSSYYNCIPTASVNPYERGCSSIARCGRY
ncbi:hypothetical protein RND81_05G203900 [Saponaria officinalis]|uniref:Uncharacterized protein n=1 Tax=Saponaria officinalis TaxID=3572 RepID=A0AAW1L2P6_SAPOF